MLELFLGKRGVDSLNDLLVARVYQVDVELDHAVLEFLLTVVLDHLVILDQVLTHQVDFVPVPVHLLEE